MRASLLHQLAFGIWAIRPECVAGYAQQVDAILSGQQPVPEQQASEVDLMRGCNLHFVRMDGERVALGSAPVQPEKGLVAVLDLTGPVMKDDFCGTPGTITVAGWLAEFEATPEVIGVVLHMDSPGGNSYAMLTLTQQLERMAKPVVAFVNAGMACSAMYGIASCCDLVYSGSDMDEFGSIGTYVRLRNYDKAAREKLGIDTHVIKATRSKAKNADVDEAMKADPDNPEDTHYKALREGYVDPFNEHFIALVQRNRPGVKDEHGVLEGKTFMAQDALKEGLIDATGKTMRDAIEAVRTLSTKKTNPKT